MQAISVELLLAENDFMSDLLETERGGEGLYHCDHGKFTALEQHALTVLQVSSGLMHQRQDFAASAPHLLVLPFLETQNCS